MKPSLVIVGGGFSGVAVAWQLLTRLQSEATVHLVNKGPLARGLAYGTPWPHHLLNVPAGRMGISPQHEAGFVDYLRGIGLVFGRDSSGHGNGGSAGGGGGAFVPRALYGAYLEWCLGDARAAATGRGVELLVHDAAAISIRSAGNGHRVTLESGAPGSMTKVHADSVLLALGNFRSNPPTALKTAPWGSNGLHTSPWTAGRLAPADPHASVLLIGSGLTAYDVVLQLRHEGHRGPVVMVSRRGLRSQSHRPLEVPPPQGVIDPVALATLAGMASVRQMLKWVRALVRRAQASGHDWRDVIAGLRSATPALWAQLGVDQRRQFLRHLAPYWDTHRHRAAVPIARRIEQELRAGSLQIWAARIKQIERSADQWGVRLVRRGSDCVEEHSFASVINCVGPSSDVDAVSDPLLQSLLARGALVADELALGVRVDENYRLLNQHGQGQAGLRYIGPLLKASLWEATAVPELRVHAQRVAQAMGQELGLRGEWAAPESGTRAF